jgi:hypothetical protein
MGGTLSHDLVSSTERKREGADQAETEKKMECKMTPTNNKNQTQ